MWESQHDFQGRWKSGKPAACFPGFPRTVISTLFLWVCDRGTAGIIVPGCSQDEAACNFCSPPLDTTLKGSQLSSREYAGHARLQTLTSSLACGGRFVSKPFLHERPNPFGMDPVACAIGTLGSACGA
jgi:hypothetical protein